MLTCAYFSGNLRVMEHLCEKGINKYSNGFITDLGDSMQWHTMSSAYAYVVDDLACGDYDTENLEAQKKILERHGVTYDIDGFGFRRVPQSLQVVD